MMMKLCITVMDKHGQITLSPECRHNLYSLGEHKMGDECSGHVKQLST